MPKLFNEPDYPMMWDGEDGDLLYGDYVRIVADYPHGKELAGGAALHGHWCEVEEYYDRQRFYVRRSQVADRKS